MKRASGHRPRGVQARRASQHRVPAAGVYLRWCQTIRYPAFARGGELVRSRSACNPIAPWNRIRSRARRSGKRLPASVAVLLVLLAQALVQAVPASLARGGPLGQNTLSLGTASGAPGTEITVPLGLANEDAVAGIQLDIPFDAGVVGFSGGAVTERTTGMSFYSAVHPPGRPRVIMSFAGGGIVPPGTGPVADLVFHAIAAGTTALTPDAPSLANPNGGLWTVTATVGQIAVTDGGGPTGACCFTDLSCQVLTADLCQAQGGQYVGDDQPCEVSTCAPNPTAPKSWGGIKSLYKSP